MTTLSKKGLNHEKVIVAAAELTEEKGFSNLSLTDLAEYLNVKPASIYNHVNNLDELATDVGIFASGQLQLKLSTAIFGKNRSEAILSLATVYREFAREHTQLYKAFIAAHFVHNTKAETSIHGLVLIFLSALSLFDLTEEQQIHWERILRSTLHGFVSFEEAGYFTKLPAKNDATYKLAIQNIIVSIEAMERLNQFQKSKTSL